MRWWFRQQLYVQILVAIVVGVALGVAFGDRVSLIEPVGVIFIRLLKMLIVPLTFLTLISGITKLESIRSLRSIGGLALLYYSLSSLVAGTVGVGVALFPKSDEPNEARSMPIKALWKFMQAQKPDWVVDLHEGFDFNIANSKSVGSSIVYFDTPEMQELAAKIHDDVNLTIEDPNRKIVKRSKSGPVNGGLVRASIEQLGAKGFCFETTFTKQPISTRTRQHRIMVHRLMRELEMVDDCDVHVMTSATDASRTRVAVYDAGGTGGKGVQNLERILESKPTFILHHVGPADIQGGVLDQFDVVIFPGGSGSKEAAAVVPPRKTVIVARFCSTVENVALRAAIG